MKYLTIAAVAAAVLAWSQLAYAQGWQHCATEGGFCRAPAGAVRLTPFSSVLSVSIAICGESKARANAVTDLHFAHGNRES